MPPLTGLVYLFSQASPKTSVASASPREDDEVLEISNLRGINTIEANDADNTSRHKYKASTAGGALCGRSGRG